MNPEIPNNDCPNHAEDLREHLSKAHALIRVALSNPHLDNHPMDIIHDYLWTLDKEVRAALENYKKLIEEAST